MNEREEAGSLGPLRDSSRSRAVTRSFGLLLCTAILAGAGGLAMLLHGEETHARPDVAPSGNKVSATMEFKIKAQPGTKSLVLDVALPRSVAGRQQIIDVRCKPQATTVYEQDGQPYAQFRIDRFPEGLTIVIDVTAEVYRSDYATATREGRGPPPEDKDTLSRWLIDEPYLERYSPNVERAAEGLAGKDEETTLRHCFDFVVNGLTTRPYDAKDYGAAWALERRKGDCTEFADLFIALCRSKGIPARFCQGYLLEHVPDTPKHDWAEVHTEKYGWVPFDPFYAHLGKATTFSERRPIYLIIDMQRRNGVLQNYHFWTYRYRGDPAQIQEQFRVNMLEEIRRADAPG